MIKENIVLIDSNEDEGLDFIKGLEYSTKDNWKLIVKKNNDRTNKLKNIIRFIKYFWFPFLIFINRNKYSKIIAWQQFYGLAFAFYCKLFKVKKVNCLLVMTFIYKEKKGFIGKIHRSFYNYLVSSEYIDKFTCVANIECINYSKIFNVSTERFHYVPWGINDFSLKYKYDDNYNKDKPYFFSAGKSNRDWDFIFQSVGDTEYSFKVICGENNRKNLYKNIEVYCNIDDDAYYQLLRNCYCVIISIKDCTISAGQITLLQAMQFGKPVILTQSDGLTNDYLINGETGLIVNKDKKSLLDAIKKIIGDYEIYKKLSCNGRSLYLSNYSTYRMGKDIGDLIKQITK